MLRSIFVFIVLACSLISRAEAAVERRIFTDPTRNQVIKLEWLNDSLIHFEFTHGIGRKSADPIYVSQMIKPQTYQGPSSFTEKEVFI